MHSQQLVQLFLTESDDLIADLEDGLMSLEDSPDDRELLNRIFRAAHTIKGNAGLTGFGPISDFTHVMENVLDRLRESQLQATGALVTSLLKSVDVLKTMVGRVAENGSLDDVPGREASIESLRRYMGVEGASGGAAGGDMPAPETVKPGARVFEIGMRFHKEILQTGQDPGMLVEEVAELGKLLRVEVDASRVPPFDELSPTDMYLAWTVVVESEEPKSAFDNIFLFVVDDNEISIDDVTERYKDGVDLDDATKPIGELLVESGDVPRETVDEALAQQKRTGELLVESGAVAKAKVEAALARQATAREVKRTTSIRVDTDKLDGLVNLVGELVIGVARVSQTVGAPESTEEDRAAALEALDHISRDLQEQVMLVRMVPVAATFSRFKRTVRDMADDLGKSIQLKMEGTETELDKNVIEQLADPLKHLIRNSVDHGLEPPEERVAAGKPEMGTVTLRASQSEGSILIEVIDDGRGINGEKVLQKAIERGVVGEGEELSEKRKLALLFEPGFSTAEKVTSISGRGVGLDVVRRNLEDLRGSIDILSKPGEGTTFRITLPLTLAIIEGMKVQVGEETLVIPLLAICEQIRPQDGQVKVVEGHGEVVNIRGEFLPLVRLYDKLGFEPKSKDPQEGLAVVIESKTRRFCLMVDDVLGQEQAVIKALDKNFRKVKGIAGATILGDGRVSLILDIHGVEHMAFG